MSFEEHDYLAPANAAVEPTRTAVPGGTNDPQYEIPADAVLYVYWCPKCQKQIDKLWHTFRRGPALIPQLDEEHYGVRVPVVARAAVARAEEGTDEG